jgi:perosamine synthetase
VQLDRLDEMLARRRTIAMRYLEAFENDERLEVLASHDDRDHAWHLFIIKLNTETLRIDRNRFIELLKERGIGTSVHFIPLHCHPYYRDMYDLAPDDLPVAHALYQRTVSLPIYSAMTDADVERVIATVSETLDAEVR